MISLLKVCAWPGSLRNDRFGPSAVPVTLARARKAARAASARGLDVLPGDAQALAHDGADRHDGEAARARLGQPAGQHVEGGAVRMADPDGAATAQGHGFQALELAGDRGPVAPFVVEEDVALGVGHAGVPGHGGADAGRRGDRIEEQQAAAPERAHDGSHAPGRSGEAAAHMVVDADEAVEALQTPVEPARELRVRQIGAEHVGPGIVAGIARLHGHVQHQFVTGRPRLPGHAPQALRIGHEGERERPLLWGMTYEPALPTPPGSSALAPITAILPATATLTPNKSLAVGSGLFRVVIKAPVTVSIPKTHLKKPPSTRPIPLVPLKSCGGRE